MNYPNEFSKIYKLLKFYKIYKSINSGKLDDGIEKIASGIDLNI
jgi:hypothetical protein